MEVHADTVQALFRQHSDARNRRRYGTPIRGPDKLTATDLEGPLHSAVSATLEISLESDTQAPSLARAAITGFCDGSRISQELLATLTLLVSEVVTNAVLHAKAPPASEIVFCAQRLGEHTVRVEVTDQGSGFTPTPCEPGTRETGHGLYLLETQAVRWGVEQHGGTSVWFEIAA